MVVITVHGRLAHQPELKIGAKTAFCEFRLLSNRFAAGEEHVEAVTFFCFGEVAERFCETAEKGQLVSATGTQESQRWSPPDGPERSVVRYRLTWWQAGARPQRARQGASGDPVPAAGAAANHGATGLVRPGAKTRKEDGAAQA